MRLDQYRALGWIIEIIEIIGSVPAAASCGALVQAQVVRLPSALESRRHVGTMSMSRCRGFTVRVSIYRGFVVRLATVIHRVAVIIAVSDNVAGVWVGGGCASHHWTLNVERWTKRCKQAEADNRNRSIERH